MKPKNLVTYISKNYVYRVIASPWYKHTQKPIRSGLYQTRGRVHPKDVFWRKYDAVVKKWSWPANTPDEALQLRIVDPHGPNFWRGIVEKFLF